MSQTCHCCNQLSGDCNFDYCSPWVFSMDGPSPPNQQPFYNGDFYSFKAEFDTNSFIWSLSPELNCGDPIYSSRSQYDEVRFMMSKVFYINSNKNININLMMENTGLDLMYKIQMKSLRSQCFYCREFCSDSGGGISFNYPVSLDCFNFGQFYCSKLYNTAGIYTKSNVPSVIYTVPPQFRTLDCSKIYNSKDLMSFNTGSFGGFWLLTIVISEAFNYIPNHLGYKTTGAISIDGISDSICSRFSKLMMTSEDGWYTSSRPVKQCFISSFYTNGTIDNANNIRGSKEMIWGRSLMDSPSCNYNKEDIIFCDYGDVFFDHSPTYPIMTLYSYGMYGEYSSSYSGFCSPYFIYDIN